MNAERLRTNDSPLTHVKRQQVGPRDSGGVMPDAEAGVPASHPSHTTQRDDCRPQPSIRAGGLADDFYRRIFII